jgi:hypothetical protein
MIGRRQPQTLYPRRGVNNRYPLYRRLGGPYSLSERRREERISDTTGTQILLPVIQPVASGCTECSIATYICISQKNPHWSFMNKTIVIPSWIYILYLFMASVTLPSGAEALSRQMLEFIFGSAWSGRVNSRRVLAVRMIDISAGILSGPFSNTDKH